MKTASRRRLRLLLLRPAAAADLDLDHAVCLFSETAWACEPTVLSPAWTACFLSFF
jgi:hypothetical protein